MPLYLLCWDITHNFVEEYRFFKDFKVYPFQKSQENHNQKSHFSTLFLLLWKSERKKVVYIHQHNQENPNKEKKNNTWMRIIQVLMLVLLTCTPSVSCSNRNIPTAWLWKWNIKTLKVNYFLDLKSTSQVHGNKFYPKGRVIWEEAIEVIHSLRLLISTMPHSQLFASWSP